MSRHTVTVDTGAGLLTVRVRTFGPDWRAIAADLGSVGVVGRQAQEAANLYRAEITAKLKAKGVLR